MVEIAKAFRSDLSVLILDEPTASLTERETDRLFELIEAGQGRGRRHHLYHPPHERDPPHRRPRSPCCATADTLPPSMPRHSRRRADPADDRAAHRSDFPDRSNSPGKRSLEVEDLTTPTARYGTFHYTCAAARSSASPGSSARGKSRGIRACFGLGRWLPAGSNSTGRTYRRHARKMIDRGFFYNPADRRAEGLVMIRNLPGEHLPAVLAVARVSTTACCGSGEEKRIANELAKNCSCIRVRSNARSTIFAAATSRKVLLAKCLTRDVKLYVFDEPTVGVDVGTRVEIYDVHRASSARRERR